MSAYISSFVGVVIKFFFLLTPFFVLSMFMAVTEPMSIEKKRRIAIKTTFAVLVISYFLFFFGEYLFSIMGITLDAFRIGAGALLFLSAVGLVMGANKAKMTDNDFAGDISVVPLAIPFTVGPGTIGALLVMGAESKGFAETLAGCLGLAVAIAGIGVMLYLAAFLERLIGKNGLQIMSKITGLILAALAAQLMFTGIKNFLFATG